MSLKILLLLLLVILISALGFTQNYPPGMPPDIKMPANMTPEMLEMIKKSMPPGTQLPPGMGQDGNAEGPGADKPLIDLPVFQEPTYAPQTQPGYKADYSPFGSGRNEPQRKAAVAVVNAELGEKSFILPKAESIPSKEYMLQMANERSKIAHLKFGTDELTEFSRFINWIPQFDGKQSDPAKAKEYSFAIAMGTNSLNKPNFLVAISSAVFALDPLSSVNANNFASAILTAGEQMYSGPLDKDKLAAYRNDAESGFLYAIVTSMNDSVWGEDSFTPILNFGNLCIDLGKYEEARSLFMVARKLKPTSWDAALGLAAYYYAINQPGKALAIMEDDNLDRPQKYMQAVKSQQSLQKSEEFSQLPLESPDAKYEEGIKIMAAEPIATSADFIAQLDQSERNKMRYFIEHLPPSGSFTAPPIKKLTQYASLQAISAPAGITAVEDFATMAGNFGISNSASAIHQQLDMLENMGLKIDLDMDIDDMAKHPEKYKDMNIEPDVKVSGMNEFMSNVDQIEKDAIGAERDLTTGKTASTIAMGAKIDPFINILQINPEEYADPMNILTQKFNYAVYSRKVNLFNAYLFSLNKRLFRQVNEDVERTSNKIAEITKQYDLAIDAYDKQLADAIKAYTGDNFPQASWDIKLHNIHKAYYPRFNNASQTGYGSATNIAAVTYDQKIKPTVESYYYDVIRHIALISDPEIRNQKETLLRTIINSSLSSALQSVLIAHASFRYLEEWDCNCDVGSLEAAREAEQKVLEMEEKAQAERNKKGKQVFDSKDIPQSSQLWKKLDSYADEYNFVFFKARVSCARTTIQVNTDAIPHNLPGNLFYSSSTNEFTGVTTGKAGVEVGIKKDVGQAKVSANANVAVNFTQDGKGVFKDISVTPGGDVGVKVGNFKGSLGGNYTVGSGGVSNYSINGSAKSSVEYGSTTVSGGATFSYSPKGFDNDFSAGISHDLKNEVGGSANVSMEASTKRGCSMSGKIEQNLEPGSKFLENSGVEDHAKDAGMNLPTDFLTKELWSGKYETKKN